MIKKILIIGLGGAGQRHLRIIRQNNKKVKIFLFRKKKLTPLLSNNFNPIFSSSIEKKFNCQNLTSAEILKEKFSLIIVANPTSLHLKTCLKLKDNANFFLIEKPFSNKFNESLSYVKKNKKNIIFLTGYQKIFEPTWNLYKKKFFIKKKIKKIFFKTYSNVKEWHPYENYKNLYACRKSLGGGVILTECHEIRYAYDLLGMPVSVVCIPNKKVENLNVETSAIIIMNYKNIQVLIELNMLSTKIERSCEIVSDTETTFINFNKKSIFIIKKNKEKKINLKFNNNYNFEEQWRYVQDIFFKNKVKDINDKTIAMIKLLKKIYEAKSKNKEIFI